MSFKITSELDEREIFEGMKIDYTVRPLFGIAMHWQTEIIHVQRNRCFTDQQLKGPYKVWKHTHSFVETQGGVLIHDVVNYKLPFGPLGDFVRAVLVKRKIENIFHYRKKVLDKMFPLHNNTSA